jgi:hypothetical protein
LFGRVTFTPWNGAAAKVFRNTPLEGVAFTLHDYWRPFDEFWACFDSYGFTTCVVMDDEGGTPYEYKGLIGFQMTVGVTHEVIGGHDAAEEFDRYLEKAEKLASGTTPWLIFVVPESKCVKSGFTPHLRDEYRDRMKNVRIFVMQANFHKEPSTDSHTWTGQRVSNELSDDKHERDRSGDDHVSSDEILE